MKERGKKKMQRQCVKNMIFQDGATSVGGGQEFAVGGENEITFNVTGTSTSRTLVFEGSVDDGSSYQSIACINMATLDSATQTTGNNEIWNAYVVGLTRFRVRLSAVAGGNVTCKGRVMA